MLLNKSQKEILKFLSKQARSLRIEDIAENFEDFDGRSLHQLVIKGYVDEFISERFVPTRNINASFVLYRITEKGLSSIGSIWKIAFYDFRSNPAVWIGVATIFFSLIGTIYTAQSFYEFRKSNQQMNIASITFDRITVEEIKDKLELNDVSDDEVFVAIEYMNNGNLPAVNLSIDVYLGDEIISSSPSNPPSVFLAPQDSGAVAITLSKDQANSMMVGSEDSKVLSFVAKYQDTASRDYCFEIAFTSTKFDGQTIFQTSKYNNCDK